MIHTARSVLSGADDPEISPTGPSGLVSEFAAEKRLPSMGGQAVVPRSLESPPGFDGQRPDRVLAGRFDRVGWCCPSEY